MFLCVHYSIYLLSIVEGETNRKRKEEKENKKRKTSIQHKHDLFETASLFDFIRFFIRFVTKFKRAKSHFIFVLKVTT